LELNIKLLVVNYSKLVSHWSSNCMLAAQLVVITTVSINRYCNSLSDLDHLYI